MTRTIRKKCLAILMVFLFVSCIVTPVLADTPYQGYAYNFWGWMVPAPAAYVPLRSFGLHDICPELGDMTEPTELHVCPLGYIYIVDSGNDRIVVIDRYLNLIRVLEGFYRDGAFQTFNRPTGVFVTPDLQLFIADTDNHRIAVLDQYDNFVRQIDAPVIEGLEDEFIFLPLHLVVDRGGRTFVIVQRVFEGIMSFNSEGDFIGYFGTIDVDFNPIDMFWRLFQTQEQRSRQRLFIPTEFQGMDIDDYGFIFTTNIEAWAGNDQVMRLNPRGEDVLLNLNDNVGINGDQMFRPGGALAGPTIFVDIVAMSHGMYAAIDSTRGRIYTYDSEGNLLHVVGGWGTLQGMTRRPVSVQVIDDDFIILDAHGRGRIIQYTPTEYGALINTAIRARYDGNEQVAYQSWRRLVEIDENFVLAWSGIGRAMLAQGDNVQAMYYLRRGMDIRYYSVAFRRNRLDRMQTTLPNLLTGAAGLLVLYVAYKVVMRFRKKGVIAQ